MRLFGSDRIASIMERMGLKEGEVIQHPMITRSVERAQRKVEENNFGIRKRLLEYDNVMNQQREVDLHPPPECAPGRPDQGRHHRPGWTSSRRSWWRSTTTTATSRGCRTSSARSCWSICRSPPSGGRRRARTASAGRSIEAAATEFYQRKEEKLGGEIMARIEKMVVLQVIDEKWKDHLREMDDLKEGIHLRAYGQKDPLVEYKTEAFRMFMELLDIDRCETLNLVFKLFPAATQEEALRRRQQMRQPRQMTLSHETSTGMGLKAPAPPEVGEGTGAAATAARHRPAEKIQPVQVGKKPAVHDPCPCGSGKKFKHCHGA